MLRGLYALIAATAVLAVAGCEARDAVNDDPFACSAPGDCSAGFDCLIDRCVPTAELVCEADGDCPSPWVCEAGRCAAPRGGRCQPEAGTCPEGFSCAEGRCLRDPDCADDGDCPEGQVCGPGEVCVGCVVDGDCPPGERCLAQACGDACRGDEDCGGEQICEAAACVEGCRLDGDCAGARICDEGSCEDGCDGPEDCDGDERCELGRCKPLDGVCRDDADCEGDLACRDGDCVPFECEVVADCPDPASWGCFEGVCLRRECADGDLCEGGALCRDGQCTDCVDTAECRAQGRVGWQCWDGFCLPPCEPLNACCGEDGQGNAVRLPACEADARIRCAHRPEFWCDTATVKVSVAGVCELDPAAPDQQMVCEAVPDGAVNEEPAGDCPDEGTFCVEDDAGDAGCAARLVCDCSQHRDHFGCLDGEGRCVDRACRGWRCDAAECNSRGPWFSFPFLERIEPWERLPNQDGHIIRGERFMDVEWAFPGLGVRKASQWDAHTHCADLGEGVAGASTDWRLPTVNELITLTQRDPEVDDLELPAIARTVRDGGAMVVYFGDPPDGGPRVRAVPLENPDGQRFWPVCVRPAFPLADAALPPLRRELDPNGGLADGVDPWTGASWTQAGEADTAALARFACDEVGARLPTVSEVYSLLDFHPRGGARGAPVDVLTGRYQMDTRVWAGLPGDGVAQVDLGSGEVITREEDRRPGEARCVQAPCQDDLECLAGRVCAGGFCAQDGADPNDQDGDGVEDLFDNCAETPNPGQADTDADGLGDACDVCPNAARHNHPCCNGGDWGADGTVVDEGQPRRACENAAGCSHAVVEIVRRCECREGAPTDCFEAQEEVADCGALWCDPQTLDCRNIAACAEDVVDCAEADEHTRCAVPDQPDRPARCVVGQCCPFDRATALCNELGPSFDPPRRALGQRLRQLPGNLFRDDGTGLMWIDTGNNARDVATLHQACARLRLDADNDGEADQWRLPTFLELLSLRPENLANLPGLLEDGRLLGSRTMLGNAFYAVDLLEMRSRAIADGMALAGALCVRVAEPAETWPRPRNYEVIGNGVFEDPWTGWRVKEAGQAESLALATLGCSAMGAGGEVWRLPTASDAGLLVRYYERPRYTVSGAVEPAARVWLDEVRVDGAARADRVLNLESGQLEARQVPAPLIRCVAPPVAGGEE